MKLEKKYLKKFIPLVSTSDLAFILIIFFILISYFSRDEGFLLKLSENNIQPIIIKSKIVTINISSNETIYLDNKIVNLIDIKNYINDLIQNKNINPKNIYIKLEIKNNVNYGNVVKIIDLIREFNLNNFSLNLIE